MRNLIGLAVIGIFIVSCGSPQEAPRASGEKLYEAVGPSILVIDSTSHAVERRLPLGTPSPDWKHLYSMLGDSLVDTDPLTGDTRNATPVGSQYQLPLATSNGMPGGLSPAGVWLVLQAYDTHGPAATHMIVIDTARFRVADTFDLPGRFNFDAISDDGMRLYLIQYLNGKEYYVRLFDVPANTLDANIVVDKSDGNQAMAGRRLSGIAAPDGSMLFSMYVRENESPFVHALNLGGPFAFCLDLPGSGYSPWALAMTRDGSRLYAVGGATGVVAELDTSNQFSPQVVRTANVSAGAGAAVLTADGRTLIAAGTSGLTWIDTRSLKARMRSLTEWNVTGLVLGLDGETVYATSDSGKVAAVSIATAEVLDRFDPAAGKPTALMRVAAA